MRRAISCLPLVLLFLVNALPSHAQKGESEVSAGSESGDGAGAGGGGAAPAVVQVDLKMVYYEVRGNLSLDCRGLAPQGDLIWRKNNTLLEKRPELKDRYEVTKEGVFSIKGRAHEDDYGNYTCSAGEGADAAARGWRVQGRPHAKLSANVNVVEGQKLKLLCKLIGKPYPTVVWTYNNVSESVNGSVEVTAALGARATLHRSEQEVEGGVLVVEPAERGDAGWYTCTPRGGEAATTTLRVKDMYAALWPFLGICAEVVVLCAIILVYERRRTKPELDDSDTDNHDQKKS